MKYQNIFKRYEFKYMLSPQQKDAVMKAMQTFMREDEYGKGLICNLYYDTPNYLLIRRSIEKPHYKEKLRLRSYGVAKSDSTVFAEIKKKYDSVVYKRRVSMSESEAMKYLSGGSPAKTNQITNEIDYFMSLYGGLSPSVYISYEREAFYAADNRGLRITFDNNILWRDDDLLLCSGAYGNSLLKPGQTLMEIKTSSGMPMWLVRTLSENKIYKTSFSKYGEAYKEIFLKTQTGGAIYA